MDTSITVDIKDDESYVDLSTLDAYVSGADAYRASLGGFQPPYSGSITGPIDARTLVLNRATDFSYGELVTVRIVVDDYGANTLDYSWSFTTIVDVTAPYLANQSPPPGTVEVAQDTLISVDILDAVSGVDLSMLDAYVDGYDAYRIGLGFVAPYDGPFSAIIPTSFGGDDGYNMVLDRTTDFPLGEVVTVRIKADDFAENNLDDSWSFTITPDVTAPYLANQFPSPGSTGVSQDSFISVDVLDAASSVDPYSLDAYVGGADAYRVGIGFVNPYDGPFSAIVPTSFGGDDGYHLIFDRTTIFPTEDVVSVRVKAEDAYGNLLDDSWIFTIIEDTPPFVSNERPLPGATGVVNRPLIHFDISDLNDDLVPSTIVVNVNSQPAFQGSSGFVSPFQGPLSDAYATVVDGHDGYHVALDPTEDLSGIVLVSVTGDDAYGTGGGGWTFSMEGTPLNFVYYSDGYGVRRIGMPALAGESQDAAVLILSEDTVPALPTNDVTTLFGNKIGDNMFLLTSMDGYGVLITTNEVSDPRHYLDGYDAYAAQMTDDGTMYVLNRTMNQVEVYYGTDFRPGGREPDVIYDAYGAHDVHGTHPLAALVEGTLSDLHVVSGQSVVHSGSTRFYVGSTEGLAKVDTYDEESPDGYSAGMDGYGLSWTYGIPGSGMAYEVLGSPNDPNTAKEVVAVHSDDVGGLLLVVTNDGYGNGGLTQVNINSNRRILFMNQQGGFLPTNYARDVFKKSS